MKSIDVEARTGGRKNRNTCLMTAAWHGYLDVCRVLIDKGAQVNAKGWNGMTPLHWAISNGKLEIVRLIRGHGADVKARDDDGCNHLLIQPK